MRSPPKAYVDIQKIVRDTIREIGYTRGKYGFDADTCAVITAIDEQSTDIAMGVDKALEAKENIMMDDESAGCNRRWRPGYDVRLCNQRDPGAICRMPICLAHKLAQQLTKVRKDGTLSVPSSGWKDSGYR
ncbi:MAG: S-adenosylmethionine synthetase N-terminal domain-containing protein [Lacrimispora saccharolytica]